MSVGPTSGFLMCRTALQAGRLSAAATSCRMWGGKTRPPGGVLLQNPNVSFSINGAFTDAVVTHDAM